MKPEFEGNAPVPIKCSVVNSLKLPTLARLIFLSLVFLFVTGVVSQTAHAAGLAHRQSAQAGKRASKEITELTDFSKRKNSGATQKPKRPKTPSGEVHLKFRARGCWFFCPGRMSVNKKEEIDPMDYVPDSDSDGEQNTALITHPKDQPSLLKAFRNIELKRLFSEPNYWKNSQARHSLRQSALWLIPDWLLRSGITIDYPNRGYWGNSGINISGEQMEKYNKESVNKLRHIDWLYNRFINENIRSGIITVDDDGTSLPKFTLHPELVSDWHGLNNQNLSDLWNIYLFKHKLIPQIGISDFPIREDDGFLYWKRRFDGQIRYDFYHPSEGYHHKKRWDTRDSFGGTTTYLGAEKKPVAAAVPSGPEYGEFITKKRYFENEYETAKLWADMRKTTPVFAAMFGALILALAIEGSKVDDRRKNTDEKSGDGGSEGNNNSASVDAVSYSNESASSFSAGGKLTTNGKKIEYRFEWRMKDSTEAPLHSDWFELADHGSESVLIDSYQVIGVKDNVNYELKLVIKGQEDQAKALTVLTKPRPIVNEITVIPKSHSVAEVMSTVTANDSGVEYCIQSGVLGGPTQPCDGRWQIIDGDGKGKVTIPTTLNNLEAGVELAVNVALRDRGGAVYSDPNNQRKFTLKYDSPVINVNKPQDCDFCANSIKLEADIDAKSQGGLAYRFIWRNIDGSSPESFQQPPHPLLGDFNSSIHVEYTADKGLEPGKDYFLDVIVFDRFGNRYPSTGSQQFSTAGASLKALGLSGKTATTADTVNSVNPRRKAADYFVQYSDGVQTLKTDPPVHVESGNDPVEANVQLTGLTPNTTYSYQLIAVNQDGIISKTEPIVFTTDSSSSVDKDPGTGQQPPPQNPPVDDPPLPPPPFTPVPPFIPFPPLNDPVEVKVLRNSSKRPTSAVLEVVCKLPWGACNGGLKLHSVKRFSLGRHRPKNIALPYLKFSVTAGHRQRIRVKLPRRISSELLRNRSVRFVTDMGLTTEDNQVTKKQFIVVIPPVKKKKNLRRVKVVKANQLSDWDKLLTLLVR